MSIRNFRHVGIGEIELQARRDLDGVARDGIGALGTGFLVWTIAAISSARGARRVLTGDFEAAEQGPSIAGGTFEARAIDEGDGSVGDAGAAKFKEAGGVGMTEDDSVIREPELGEDFFRGAPVHESCVDGEAFRMAADSAFAGVAFRVFEELLFQIVAYFRNRARSELAKFAS